jgi:hypothetical protein
MIHAQSDCLRALAFAQGSIDILKCAPNSAPDSALQVALTIKPPSQDDLSSAVTLGGSQTAAASGSGSSIRCMGCDPTGSRVALYVRGAPIVVLNNQLLKVCI